MDHEFGYPGFEMFEGIFVESGPLCGRKARRHRDDAIDDNVIRTESFFEIGKIAEPVSRDEHRKIIFVSYPENDFEKIFVGLEKSILVRVKMCGLDAHS